MYRVSAGIEIGAPGYKHILIQPHPNKKLTYAKASFESSYGTIASGWETKEGKLIVRVSIPANTTATVILPVKDISVITESGVSVTTAFKNIKQENQQVIIELGSGEYVFDCGAAEDK
jgi:alpha-L-rhamnosidase